MSRKRRGRGEGGVEQLPDGRWRAVLSLGIDPVTGKRRRRKFYGTTKAEALGKLRDAQQQSANGTLADSKGVTVEAWLNQWLALKRGKVEAATYRRIEQTTRLRLIPNIGSIPLAKLSPLHIEAMYSHMEQNGVSRSEQRRAGSTLSTALRHAVRLRLVGANVAGEVRKPKGRKTEFVALAREQVQAFLRATVADRLHAMYVFWLDTGCRPGEVYGLHWNAVDLDAGTVQITRSLEEIGGKLSLKTVKTPKGNRTLALASSTVKVLRDYRERMRAAGRNVESGIVFCDRRGGYLRRPNVQRRSFWPALTRAGVPRIRPYDLRHTTATLLLAAGVNIKIVSERLGHASIQITLDHYAKCLPGMQSVAAEAMEGILSNPPDCPLDCGDYCI